MIRKSRTGFERIMRRKSRRRARATILVFDSGLGGLTVYREIAAARPDANYIYLADDAAFPYGDMPEQALITRILHVIGKARVEHDRTWLSSPATPPPPSPSRHCARSTRCPLSARCRRSSRPARNRSSKRVTVLGTQATVSREYTRALIREFAQGCEVEPRRLVKTRRTCRGGTRR